MDNLAAIIDDGCLRSDATLIATGRSTATIGMSTIKQRRLRLQVDCHPGTAVGDFVPFYFCPRSVMLYVIYRQNNSALEYRGGQAPILHLRSSIDNVVAWAERMGTHWAFSASNAGASYTTFSAIPAELDRLDWVAIANNQWQVPEVKEAKQAEFLVHGQFPWGLVDEVGVYDVAVQAKVTSILARSAHRPPVEVRRDWYY
jgi:hypothetical protein